MHTDTSSRNTPALSLPRQAHGEVAGRPRKSSNVLSLPAWRNGLEHCDKCSSIGTSPRARLEIKVGRSGLRHGPRGERDNLGFLSFRHPSGTCARERTFFTCKRKVIRGPWDATCLEHDYEAFRAREQLGDEKLGRCGAETGSPPLYTRELSSHRTEGSFHRRVAAEFFNIFFDSYCWEHVGVDGACRQEAFGHGWCTLTRIKIVLFPRTDF